MNIPYYYYFCLLLFFSACSSQSLKDNIVKTLPIHLEDHVEADIASIIDSAYFVVPETNDSSIIGKIGTINITDRIILTDRMTNKIILFKLNGEHIATVDKVGNGPGEYIRIDGLCTNPKNGDIVILDAMKNKLITFDKNFNFINEQDTPVPFGATAFAIMDNNSFAFEQSINSIKTDLKYNLFIKSKDTSITHLLPFEKTANTVFSPRITFYYLNDTLIYVPTYNETIYNIFPEKAEARVRFDFGNKWVKEEFVYDPVIAENPITFMSMLKEQDFVCFFNEMENKTHLYADFSYKGNNYILTYNKTNGKQVILKKRNKEILQEKPIYTFNDFFIVPVSYSECMDILNSDKFSFRGKEYLHKIKEQIKDESNPILMFIKFK